MNELDCLGKRLRNHLSCSKGSFVGLSASAGCQKILRNANILQECNMAYDARFFSSAILKEHNCEDCTQTWPQKIHTTTNKIEQNHLNFISYVGDLVWSGAFVFQEIQGTNNGVSNQKIIYDRVVRMPHPFCEIFPHQWFLLLLLSEVKVPLGCSSYGSSYYYIWKKGIFYLWA